MQLPGRTRRYGADGLGREDPSPVPNPVHRRRMAGAPLAGVFGLVKRKVRVFDASIRTPKLRKYYLYMSESTLDYHPYCRGSNLTGCTRMSGKRSTAHGKAR